MDSNKKHQYFVQGPIQAQTIADSLASHSRKKNIGAHQIFIGQARADVINDKTVTAIEFTAYQQMAELEIEKIRENSIVKFGLSCAHIKHSLGWVNAGQICFYVFVSSPHRKAATEACAEMVELIKKEVPIFGKEQFDDNEHEWKVNKP